jgi:hypothetical protein
MVSITIPSLSQDASPQSQCGEAFKQIDTNNDGVLTHTEIPKAKDLPAQFAKEVLVGRQEFMAACVKAAEAKQAEKAAPAPPPGESPQGQPPASK